MIRICAQACKKITFNKLMQLMEHSMDIPNVSMILFSNTYNPRWRDHPNLCYGNPPQQGNQGRQFHPCGFQSQQNYQVRQPPAFTNSNVMGSSSDDIREMMKTLASNTVTL